MADTLGTILDLRDGVLRVDGRREDEIDIDGFLKNDANKEFIEAFEIAGGVKLPKLKRDKKENEFEWRSRVKRAERDAAKKVSKEYSKFGKRLNALLIDSGFHLENDAAQGPVCLLLDDEAAKIPWEFLQDGNKHIAATRGIVRLVDESFPGTANDMDADLSVFFASSSPFLEYPSEDEKKATAALLDVHTRVEHLRGAELQMDLRLAPFATRANLLEGLGDDPTVFHFHGHGTHSGLALEDSNWCTDLFEAWELEDALSNKGIRLAVFEACLTARSTAERLEKDTYIPTYHLSSCKAALKAGVPCVVAMRASITVGAANVFTTAFYKSLSKGKSPLVAYRQAVERMLNSPNRHHPYEWAIPAVHCPVGCIRMLSKSSFRKTDPSTVILPSEAKLIGLPPRKEKFIGRRRELVDIAQYLNTAHSKKALLVGQHGIGKSNLSVEAANRLRFSDRFKQVIWATARSKQEKPAESIEPHLMGASMMLEETPEQSLFSMLSRNLGLSDLEGSSPREQCTGINNHLKNDHKKRLLILDNLESIKDMELLKAFLSSLPPRISVLGSSTEPLPGMKWDEIRVTSLIDRDAYELMSEESEALSRRPSLFAKAVKALGGNPLAISLFMAVVDRGLEDIDLVVQHTENISDDFPELFEYIFGEFFERLTEGERRVLGTICLLEPVAPRPLIERISCISGQDITDILSGLLDTGQIWIADRIEGKSCFRPYELTRFQMLKRLDDDEKKLRDDPGQDDKECLRDELRQKATGALFAALDDDKSAEIAIDSLSALGIGWMQERKIEAAHRIWQRLRRHIGEEPSDYRAASIAANLAYCLADLPASADKRIRNLQSTIDLHSQALNVLRRDRYPEDWAMTQNNLGNAYSDLPSATAEERAENLKEAVQCYETVSYTHLTLPTN